MHLIGDIGDPAYRRSKCEELKQMILQKNDKLVSDFKREVSHLLDPADTGITGGANHSSKNNLSLAQPPPAELCSSPPPQSGNGNFSPAKATNSGNTKPLEQLTVDDVTVLLESLNMGQYAAAVKEQAVDGPCLACAECVDELKEMGVSMTAKAKMLYKCLSEYKMSGVPEEFTHSYLVRSFFV